MSDQELLQGIRALHDVDGFEVELIANIKILFKKENKRLLELFNKRENPQEKWSQIVSFVFEDLGERKFLTEKIMRLLWSHYKKYTDYFEIVTETGRYALPDRFSDFVRLRTLYEKYFEIYNNIKKRVNFDYPTEKFSETTIQGKINWSQTFRRSPFLFPTVFQTTNWVRKFETPENTLLILYAFVIRNDCMNILNKSFEGGLFPDEHELIQKIIDGTKKILSTFPFRDVVKQAKLHSNFDLESRQNEQLLKDTKKRINSRQIRNPEYIKLIKWIDEYRHLNVQSIRASKSKFQLRHKKDLDFLYELWIFLEFFSYVRYQKHREAKIYPGTPAYISFELQEKTVKFYWSKKFEKYDPDSNPNSKHKTNDDIAWVRKVNPDFSAMVDDKLIAVFDAKNYYNKKSRQSEFDDCEDIRKIILKIEKNRSRRNQQLEQLQKQNIDVKKYELLSTEDRQIDPNFKILNDLDKKFQNLRQQLGRYNPEGFLEYFSSGNEEISNEKIKIMREKNQEKLEKYSEINKDDTSKIKSKETSAMHTMLYYMVNLDVNYGALLFSNYDPSTIGDYEYPKEGQTQRFLTGKFKFEHFRIKKSSESEFVQEKYDAFERILTILKEQIKNNSKKLQLASE